MSGVTKKRARRPLSYGRPDDREPCEGRKASPSNPTKSSEDPVSNGRNKLNSVVVFRCSALEKEVLVRKAERAGLPFAELMREALGLADSRRRKPVPHVDPVLIRSVSRIGSNVNQIARWLNATTSSGHLSEIDAIEIIGSLIAVDRALTHLIRDNASTAPSVKDSAC